MSTETFLIRFFIIIHLSAVRLYGYYVPNKRHNFLAELQAVRNWIMPRECLSVLILYSALKLVTISIPCVRHVLRSQPLFFTNCKLFTTTLKPQGVVDCENIHFGWSTIWKCLLLLFFLYGGSGPLLFDSRSFIRPCHFDQTKGYPSVSKLKQTFVDWNI